MGKVPTNAEIDARLKQARASHAKGSVTAPLSASPAAPRSEDQEVADLVALATAYGLRGFEK